MSESVRTLPAIGGEANENKPGEIEGGREGILETRDPVDTRQALGSAAAAARHTAAAGRSVAWPAVCHASHLSADAHPGAGRANAAVLAVSCWCAPRTLRPPGPFPVSRLVLVTHMPRHARPGGRGDAWPAASKPSCPAPPWSIPPPHLPPTQGRLRTCPHTPLCMIATHTALLSVLA